MPETPNFDQIARGLACAIAGLPGHGAVNSDIAEQLRLVWNARGAADIAKVDALLAYVDRVRLAESLDRAIRTLDR